nr:hypothetical protein Iba_chr03aCG14990 [Ipomoea batatas]
MTTTEHCLASIDKRVIKLLHDTTSRSTWPFPIGCCNICNSDIIFLGLLKSKGCDANRSICTVLLRAQIFWSPDLITGIQIPAAVPKFGETMKTNTVVRMTSGQSEKGLRPCFGSQEMESAIAREFAPAVRFSGVTHSRCHATGSAVIRAAGSGVSSLSLAVRASSYTSRESAKRRIAESPLRGIAVCALKKFVENEDRW